VVRPWGEVRVDGKVIGTTPLPRFELPPGRHSVQIRHPAYEVVERSVNVTSGDTLKILVDLPADGKRK
jgi:hypothetical protein